MLKCAHRATLAARKRHKIMYSLSDHYIFTETIIYDHEDQVIGKEKTAIDITPVYVLILVLIFFVILNEISKSILYKVRRAIELRKEKKKNKKNNL